MMYDFEQFDYYQLLGVDRSASPEEIKRAYRHAISLYHPDRFVGSSIEEQQYAIARAQRITEAYRMLVEMAGRTTVQSPPRRPVPQGPPPPRDHLAELYAQARDHLQAHRFVQASAVLRQLQQISPFYRDSADLLAEAERQVRAQRQGSGRRGAVRFSSLLVIGVIGVLTLGTIGVWALGRNTVFGGAVPTQAPAVVAEAPALLPTEVPTAVPVFAPTEASTALPTLVPTDEPTALPTDEPTVAPTDEPTALPTDEPTVVPTKRPTERPTLRPTAQATSRTTSAAGQPFEMGVLLESSRFNGDSGWPSDTDEGWSVSEVNGRYRITSAPGIGDIWSYRTAPTARSISIGVDVLAVSGDAGIVFRFLEAGNYLSFVVNPSDGSIALMRYSNGEPSVLLADNVGNLLDSEDWNRIVVEVSRKQARLAINGEQVGRVTLPDEPSGPYYGLVNTSIDAPGEAFFDNVEVRTAE